MKLLSEIRSLWARVRENTLSAGAGIALEKSPSGTRISVKPQVLSGDGGGNTDSGAAYEGMFAIRILTREVDEASVSYISVGCRQRFDGNGIFVSEDSTWTLKGSGRVAVYPGAVASQSIAEIGAGKVDVYFVYCFGSAQASGVRIVAGGCKLLRAGAVVTDNPYGMVKMYVGSVNITVSGGGDGEPPVYRAIVSSQTQHYNTEVIETVWREGYEYYYHDAYYRYDNLYGLVAASGALSSGLDFLWPDFGQWVPIFCLARDWALSFGSGSPSQAFGVDFYVNQKSFHLDPVPLAIAGSVRFTVLLEYKPEKPAPPEGGEPTEASLKLVVRPSDAIPQDTEGGPYYMSLGEVFYQDNGSWGSTVNGRYRQMLFFQVLESFTP